MPSTIYYERVNIDKLYHIILNWERLDFPESVKQEWKIKTKTGTIVVNPLNILTKYYNDINNKGVRPVSYFYSDKAKDLGYVGGRQFVKDGLGLQSFSRIIRQTICSEYYDDYDIVNCHPTILLQLCHKKGWGCEGLEYYIRHRDTCLADMMRVSNRTRDVCKQDCIIAIYNYGEIFTDYGLKWFDTYKRNIKEIENAMLHDTEYIAELEYVRQKQKSKPIEKQNVMGSLCSMILNRIENNILETAEGFLKLKGIPTSTLVKTFDGFQLEKKHALTHDFLQEMIQHIQKITGYTVEYIVKPMTDVFELGEIDKAPQKSPEIFRRTPIYPTVAFEGCCFKDLYKMRDYEQMKPLWESYFAKIIDNVRFIRKDEKGVFTFTNKTLKQAYENLVIETLDTKGALKTSSFIDKWCKDTSMRQYQEAKMIPPPLPCSADVFNLWVPYMWDSYVSENKGDTSVIHRHLEVLTNFKPEHTSHFTKLLAHTLQFPSKKTGVMPTFVGPEGTGKNTLLLILGRLVGKQKCYAVSSPQKQLFGNHNYEWTNAQFVVINDFNPTELKKDNAETFKTFITDTDASVNRKGIDEYQVEQYCQFLAFSNSMNPVPINKGSRRYYLLETGPVQSTEYFNELYAWMENDDNIKAWYDELMSMDLTGFVPKNFPDSVVSEIAKEANISPVEMFMTDWKDKLARMFLYKRITENGRLYPCMKTEEGCMKILNHNRLYDMYKNYISRLGESNNPVFKMHKRKFQSILYKWRDQFGLEYRGDSSNPENTCWILQEKIGSPHPFWGIVDGLEEEDVDSDGDGEE